jgi:hypothetical protein
MAKKKKNKPAKKAAKKKTARKAKPAKKKAAKKKTGKAKAAPKKKTAKKKSASRKSPAKKKKTAPRKSPAMKIAPPSPKNQPPADEAKVSPSTSFMSGLAAGAGTAAAYSSFGKESSFHDDDEE